MKENYVELIINQAIENLTEFGYEDVNRENIFTDSILSRFFRNMLNQSMGVGFDEEIRYLLGKIRQ